MPCTPLVFTIFTFSLITASTIKWDSQNVSLIQNEEEFSWRHTTLSITNAGQQKALYFSSIRRGLSDGIFGTAYAISGQPPTIQLGYFSLGSTWLDHSGVDGDYSAASGFVAAITTKIEEVSKGGDVIQSVQLNALPFSLQPMTKTDSLYSATFLGSSGNLDIAFAVAASTAVGVLDSGTVMTSETMSYGIQITDFPYRQNQTSLRLTIVQITANKESLDHSRKLLHTDRTTVGKGSSAMYMDIGTFASCDGEMQEVKIDTNHSVTTTDLENEKLIEDILPYFIKLGRKVTIRTKYVTFPAGSIDINYQTSIGATQGPIVVGEELNSIPPLTPGAVAGIVIGIALAVGLTGFFMLFRFNLNSETEYANLPSLATSQPKPPSRITQMESLPTDIVV